MENWPKITGIRTQEDKLQDRALVSPHSASKPIHRKSSALSVRLQTDLRAFLYQLSTFQNTIAPSISDSHLIVFKSLTHFSAECRSKACCCPATYEDHGEVVGQSSLDQRLVPRAGRCLSTLPSSQETSSHPRQAVTASPAGQASAAPLTMPPFSQAAPTSGRLST